MTSAAAPEVQTPVTEGRRRAKLVLVLILGSLSAFAPLSIDMYLPALPKLTGEFGTSTSLVQLSLTACLLGLATGQLVAGPLSDSKGRRRPLLVGLIGYVIASALIIEAPSIWALVALRYVQGFSGAAGLVVSRAIARDLYAGKALARFFAILMLVNGLAPILAPVLGGQILRFTSWRGVFGVLTVVGLVLFAACALFLQETLPQDRRQAGGFRTNLRTFKHLLTERSFMGFTLSAGLGTAIILTYVSGSPFVLQDVFGLSPQAFSLCFGANSIGIVLFGQVGARLINRFGSATLLTTGICMMTTGAVAYLVAIVSGLGLPFVLPSLFLAVASVGLVGPNASALALNDHGHVAGSASALLGLFQFAIGACLAPLVGIAGSATAMPMAVMMASIGVTAVAVRLWTARSHERRTRSVLNAELAAA